MNREVLFRGKRIDNGEWVEGFYFELSYDGITTPCIGTEPLSANDYSEIHSSCYEMADPSTVGQYTGLTDKNGKKIFEDDIIDINRGKFDIWRVRIDDVRRIPEKMRGSSVRSIEVVGNIHDRKENTT